MSNTKIEAWHRRHAIQVAASLPDTTEDALLVLELAKQLVDSLTGSFDPEKYRDEYQDRLKGLVDAKLQGREVASAPDAPLAPVIDMMEALKKSLAAREASAPKKPPVRAEAAPAVAEKRSSRRAAK